MNRTLLCAAVSCCVIFSVPAFAGTMPAISGQVFDGESGVYGELVELYLDDGDGSLTHFDTHVAAAMTDAAGRYTFETLDPDGAYFVMHASGASFVTPGDVRFVIDSFDLTQSVIANPVSGARMSSIGDGGTGVLGGHRDLYLDVLAGPAEARLRVNPFSLNSNLQIDMSAGVSGMASITWDGVDGISGMAPDHGLDMDFTGGGEYEGVAVRLAVDAAGEGQMLKLIIHSDEANSSMAELQFPVIENVDPTALAYVPFEEFVGTADLTSVSAFQLLMDETAPSLDAQIDLVGLAGTSTVNFEVIPEPSSLTLVGLASVMLLSVRRRS